MGDYGFRSKEGTEAKKDHNIVISIKKLVHLSRTCPFCGHWTIPLRSNFVKCPKRVQSKIQSFGGNFDKLDKSSVCYQKPLNHDFNHETPKIYSCVQRNRMLLYKLSLRAIQKLCHNLREGSGGCRMMTKW